MFSLWKNCEVLDLSAPIIESVHLPRSAEAWTPAPADSGEPWLASVKDLHPRRHPVLTVSIFLSSH
jgi:hypothetical protein